MSSKTTFKHNKNKAYIMRYHGCANVEYVETGLTKTEFEQRMEDFMEECSSDCDVAADEVIIEIFESAMFVKGQTTTKFHYGVDKPSDYDEDENETTYGEDESCEDCGYDNCRCDW